MTALVGAGGDSCGDFDAATGGSCVLVHGFNVAAENWEQIVWGTEPHTLGRVPKAVLVALQQNASLLAFGTGVVLSGEQRVESERMHAVFAERLARLRNFEALARYDAALIEALSARVFLDKTSQNTVGELRVTARECVRRGIERLYLVSSPTHVSRCLRDAHIVIADEEQLAAANGGGGGGGGGEAALAARRRWRALAQNVFATPSDVSYANADASMVVIIEPPHRPGDAPYSLNALALRMLRLTRAQIADFAFELSQLLAKFGR